MMPKTVTAETAATPRAKFLFFSIFFSSFSLDSKSVTFTLLLEELDSCLFMLKLNCELIKLFNHNDIKLKYLCGAKWV